MLVLLLLLPRCKTDDVSVAMKKKQSFWETLVSSGDTPSQGFACRRPITLQYIAACCCRRHVADCGANLSTAPLFTRAHSMCGTSSAARPWHRKTRTLHLSLQPSAESFAGAEEWKRGEGTGRVTSGDGWNGAISTRAVGRWLRYSM